MKKDPSIQLVDKDEIRYADIAAYCSNPPLQEVRKLLNERKYNIDDTGINSRVINNWEECDLLPDGLREGSGWRKFTLVEMVWLQIVVRLRNFGFALDKIAVTKDCILQLNQKTKTYDEFEYYIAKAWKTKIDPYVVVIADGNAEVGTIVEVFRLGSYIGQRDEIFISLTSIIEGFHLDAEEKYGLATLTDEQRDLLKEVYFEDNTEVMVRINKNGVIDVLSTSTINPKDVNLFGAEIQKQMKEKGIYGEYRTPIENGIPQMGQLIKRKRFKK